MLTETKLDDSFPEGQFLMEEYHAPLSLTESKMGVVLLYIPEDIPAELLCSDFLIEIVYIEINLHNKKRLIILIIYTTIIHLDKIILLGDFNVGVGEEAMKKASAPHMV